MLLSVYIFRVNLSVWLAGLGSFFFLVVVLGYVRCSTYSFFSFSFPPLFFFFSLSCLFTVLHITLTISPPCLFIPFHLTLSFLISFLFSPHCTLPYPNPQEINPHHNESNNRLSFFLARSGLRGEGERDRAEGKL